MRRLIALLVILGFAASASAQIAFENVEARTGYGTVREGDDGILTVDDDWIRFTDEDGREFLVPTVAHGPRLGIQALLTPALVKGKRRPRVFAGVHAGPLFAHPLWGGVEVGSDARRHRPRPCARAGRPPPLQMKFERSPNARDVARRAADLVGELVASRPDAVLLLPAGGTPLPLYDELVRRVHAGVMSGGTNFAGSPYTGEPPTARRARARARTGPPAAAPAVRPPQRRQIAYTSARVHGTAGYDLEPAPGGAAGPAPPGRPAKAKAQAQRTHHAHCAPHATRAPQGKDTLAGAAARQTKL